MPGVIAKKIGMTSLYTEEGLSYPVTLLKVGPCVIYDKKTIKRDGYSAIQLGYGEKKDKHTNKAEQGKIKANNLKPVRSLKEFKNFDNYDELNVGDVVDSSIFNEGDEVVVTGVSKGKGFQGVMKRHGFGGVGGTTHGQKDRLRAPGSIGQSSAPSKVFKGMKMGGRTGGDKTSVKNLRVVKIVSDENMIMVRGAVPGAINSIVEINK